MRKGKVRLNGEVYSNSYWFLCLDVMLLPALCPGWLIKIGAVWVLAGMDESFSDLTTGQSLSEICLPSRKISSSVFSEKYIDICLNNDLAED